MKIKIIKKLGKESTIRSVHKDDSAIIGIMGRVGELMKFEYFSSCSAPRDYWSFIRYEDGGRAIFAELLQRLTNYKL